jgi:hypothetical protein
VFRIVDLAPPDWISVNVDMALEDHVAQDRDSILIWKRLPGIEKDLNEFRFGDCGACDRGSPGSSPPRPHRRNEWRPTPLGPLSLPAGIPDCTGLRWAAPPNTG